MKLRNKATEGTESADKKASRLLLAVVAAVGFVAGCRQDMHDAPRYEAYEASATFADNRASRVAPVGTVARGWLREDEALYTGKLAGQTVEEFPFAIERADLMRGQERFNIYCTPCHGKLGDGNGMVVSRGLRQAASYHQDRLRQEKLGYFYDVITNGFGAMQGYAEQIPVRDRWLIVAYVRTLQMSQNASVNDVPADRRGALDAGAATASGAASASQAGTTTAKPTSAGATAGKPAEKH